MGSMAASLLIDADAVKDWIRIAADVERLKYAEAAGKISCNCRRAGPLRLRFPSQIMFAPRAVRESPGSYCLIRLALFP